jgi:hypothetical protein
MRERLLLILLFLLTFSTVCQAQKKGGYVEFADGERLELNISSPDDLDKGFSALLDGSRDATLRLTEDGQPVITFVRKGQQVTASVPGEPEQTMSIEEAKTNLALARARGMLTACKSNLKNTGVALEMWAVDHEGLYPESLSVLAPNYLKVLLQCPASGTDTYSATYKRMEEPVFYRMHCSGDHSPTGTEPGYPIYDGEQGLIEGPDEESAGEPAE